MYSVYILKSINHNKYYTGKTNDVQRRLEEHNAGKSYYTKRYTPWRLIYVEEFTEEILATEREKYLKSAAGRRFLKSEKFQSRIIGAGGGAVNRTRL